MGEWQPIETAPKDMWVMLYCPHAASQDKDVTHWIAKWRTGFGDWIDQDDAVVAWAHDPTHWMPLPEPPK